MVAQLVPERGFRGPGCTEACEVLKALVPGRFGRSELLLHDAAAHEEYGRRIGAMEGDGGERVDVVITGPLVVDVRRLVVSVDGVPINLTTTELRVLIAVARRCGAVVTIETVLSETWQGSFGYTAHAVRVHVSRIRQKLDRAAALLATVPGIGFRLDMIEQGAEPSAFVGLTYPRRITRWARGWDRCRECGTTDRPHNGHGLCSSCHKRLTKRGAS